MHEINADIAIDFQTSQTNKQKTVSLLFAKNKIYSRFRPFVGYFFSTFNERKSETVFSSTLSLDISY